MVTATKPVRFAMSTILLMDWFDLWKAWTKSSVRSTSGNPGEFTIRQLAEIVLELTGSASKIIHRALPQDDPKQSQPDISKAQELLGWQPQVPLAEGLMRTIAYFEELLTKETALA